MFAVAHLVPRCTRGLTRPLLTHTLASANLRVPSSRTTFKTNNNNNNGNTHPSSHRRLPSSPTTAAVDTGSALRHRTTTQGISVAAGATATTTSSARVTTVTQFNDHPVQHDLDEQHPGYDVDDKLFRDSNAVDQNFHQPLVDTFNRPHTYLRLSLTEKCNLRCIYCMPDTTPPSLPPPTHLTSSELLRLTRLFASRGVDKVRLTGGEPLLRHDLLDLTRELSSIDGIRTLGLTTNGITLSRMLPSLVDAGINSVNISLDTLIEPRFQLLTRRKGHARVLRAIDDCVAAGVATKVNVVVMRGVNDDELVDFVKLTEQDGGVDVRFIEYMPFDGNRWAHGKFLSYAAMLQEVARAFGRLEDTNVGAMPGDTAKYYRVPGFKGRIGFISSMTDHFCAGCNRLRITADGNLKVCLFGKEEVSLRDLVRNGASDEEVEQVIRKALQGKHFSLGGNKDMFAISQSENRSMVRIGG